MMRTIWAVGCVIAVVAAVGLWSCGPREAPEKSTQDASREWAEGFVKDRGEDGEVEGVGPATVEGKALDLRDLDRRIQALSSGDQEGGTEEVTALADDLRRAIRAMSLRGQNSREAAYRIGLALAYRRMGFPDQALEVLDQVSDLVDSGSGAVWISAATRLRGDILREEGRVPEALELYDRAFRMSASAGLWDRAYRIVDTIDAVCRKPDLHSRILALFNPGGEFADRKDLAPLGGFCTYAVRESESPTAGHAALEAAESRAGDAQDRLWLIVILTRKSVWQLRHGLYAEARGTCQQMAAYQTMLGDKVGLVGTLLRFAAAAEKIDEPQAAENARRAYRLAIKTAREINDRPGEATALSYLGPSLTQGGNHTLGLACLLEADRIAADVAPGSDLRTVIDAKLEEFKKMVGGEEVYADLEKRVRPSLDSLLAQATAE